MHVEDVNLTENLTIPTSLILLPFYNKTKLYESSYILEALLSVLQNAAICL
jgi:hypothetical protein